MPRSARWKRWVLLGLLTLSLVLGLGTVSPVSSGEPPVTRSELRGVWLTNIDSDVLFSRDRLETAVTQLAQLQFNTLYPTVWNWGYTLYPSPTARRAIGQALDPTPGLQGRDILAELVTQGHRHGMAVIPWFEFGFMAPADSQLAQRHSSWLTRRQDGSQVWMEGPHPRVWLNPFHPEVQQVILNLLLEITTRYNVDGIQLDDHFGIPLEFGYDPVTVRLYQREHRGKRPPANPQDPEWMRWRANKLTAFLDQVFHALKARKSSLVISMSPNPYPFSYQSALADWPTWERLGLVEELVIQIYRNDLTRFVAELETPEVRRAQQHIPVAIGILSGLKGRAVPSAQMQAQAQAVRDHGLAGVSFFFYETLWNLSAETPEERQRGLRSLFPASAQRPNILRGWKP